MSASISNSQTPSFYLKAGQFLGFSIFNAFPITSLYRSMMDILSVLNPSMFFKNLNDPDGEYFIFDGNQKTAQKISKLLYERCFSLTATIGSISNQDHLRGSIDYAEMHFTEKINDCLTKTFEIIKDSYRKIGIKKVDFMVSVPKKYTHTITFPLSAIGGTLFKFSSPIILISPYIVDKFLNEEPSKALQRFIINHELVHISKNHNIISTIAQVAMTVINLLAWYCVMSNPVALTTRIIISYSAALLLQIPMSLGYFALLRSHEREADQKAMDIMNSNEGALAMMKYYNFIDTCTHPSNKKRVEYMKNWKANK